MQAELLAARLSSETIDLVLSSDLSRAAQTAKTVVKDRPLEVNYVQSLRERSYGEFEGRNEKDFVSAFEKSGFSREEFRPSGGESYVDIQRRLSLAWDEYFEQFSGTVLVSGHGGTNKIFLTLLLNLPLSESAKISQKNTCLNVLEGTQRGNFKASLINCTDHLSKL